MIRDQAPGQRFRGIANALTGPSRGGNSRAGTGRRYSVRQDPLRRLAALTVNELDSRSPALQA
jgi:hypothetical protein